jgi:hypothetical protein
MNQFGLLQPVDRLGQRVVVAVAPAAHRQLDAGFGKAFGVPNRHVLRTAIRMMDQRVIALWPAGVQRLLQRIQHEVGKRPANPS